jgi:hypothetical protein
MGKTDDILRRYVPHAIECPEDAARAAAQVLGQPMMEPQPMQPPMGMPGMQPQMGGMQPGMHDPNDPMSPGMYPENMSGPKKWLRSATSIFSNRRGDSMIGQLSDFPEMDRMQPRAPTTGQMAAPPPAPPRAAPPEPPRREPKRPENGRHLDGPVPLSEFARRSQRTGINHTGHGRRDQLSAGERTRILRMLRDEGGRMADEDSQVYIGSAPGLRNDPDMDDAPAPPPSARGDIPARPAVVVGLAQAMANSPKRRRQDPSAPPPPPSARMAAQPPPPPMHLQQQQPPMRRGPDLPRPAGSGHANQVPTPFGEQRTRQVDPRLVQAARGGHDNGGFDEEATRIQDSMFPENDATQLGAVDPRMWAFEDPGMAPRHLPSFEDHREEATTLGTFDHFNQHGHPVPHGGPPGQQHGGPPSQQHGAPPPRRDGRQDVRDGRDGNNNGHGGPGRDPRLPDVDWDLE